MIQSGPISSIGLCCLFFFFLALSNSGARAEVEVEGFSDTEVSIGYSDNIGKAQRDRDIKEDNFILASYGFLSNIELDDSKAITLKAFVEYEFVDKVEDLSRSTFGAQFAYRWQNTLGYLSPFYQFNTSIQLNEYGVDQRDSTVSNTQVFVTKRMSDSVTVISGLAYYIEDSEGTVFDLEHGRFFLNLDYSSERNRLYYASYSYREGEIWSNAQVVFCNGEPADDIFPLIAAAEASEPDKAFNNAFCGEWMAYRLKASTQTFTIGASFSIGRSSALDLSAMYVDSEATKDIDYQSTIFRASFLKRF
jgi:hypothetical protein